MKAVLQYRASPGLRQQITALDFPTVVVDETDQDAFRREMADADILLHVLEPVTAAVINAGPYLKLIQKIGIGVNTIDLDAARRRGIAVCNMPGTNTQAVVEMTLLLVLATLRRLARLDCLTRAGKGWKFEPELSERRADRPHCGRRASRQAPRCRGAPACADAIRRAPAGSPRRARVGRSRRAACSGSVGQPRTSIRRWCCGRGAGAPVRTR
jgi:hypothetical protein